VKFLHKELQSVLPAFQVRLVAVEGPFEDDQGNGAHFDAPAQLGLHGVKLVKAFRVDLL
jgi:hypothetical protein